MHWNKADLYKLLDSLWKSVGVAESCISSAKVTASIHLSKDAIYVQGPYGFSWAYVNLNLNWDGFITVSEDLLKAVRLCPEGDINMDKSPDGTKILIRGGKAKTEIPIMMEDIPLVPDMTFVETVDITEELWASWTSASQFISENHSTLNVTGIYMGPEGILGTNMASFIHLNESWAQNGINIPKICFLAAQRIGRVPATFNILPNKNIVWLWDNMGLLCPSIDMGVYPVENLIKIAYPDPKNFEKVYFFEAEFTQDVDNILSKISSLSDAISIVFSSGRATIKAEDGSVRFSETINGKFDGPSGFKVKLNAKELKKMCGTSIHWDFFIPAPSGGSSLLFSDNPRRGLVFEEIME